jgi:hypothetical protein
MADEHERANGSVYREFEIALPRELTPAQRVQLVQDFVSQKIGDRHAYSFAIHNPKAAIDGGEQPHAHVMYSERIIDGIERTEDLFFKRYNAKAPERGGCQKVNRGVTAAARSAELVDTRALWGEIQNAHMAKHGHVARVDHRSLAAQGIERVAEPHIGPNRRDLYELVKAQRERVQVKAQHIAPVVLEAGKQQAREAFAQWKAAKATEQQRQANERMAQQAQAEKQAEQERHAEQQRQQAAKKAERLSAPTRPRGPSR